MAADTEKTFKKWLDDHKGLILKVLRSFAENTQDQDDLFQDICLQLWLSVPNFDGKAKASTWIYRVALNTAIVYRRGQKRRKHRPQQWLSFRCESQNENPVPLLDETIEKVYEAVRKLPRLEASVVLMSLEGLSYNEMADVLGISADNVGVKLNRARKNLAQLLKGLIDDL